MEWNPPHPGLVVERKLFRYLCPLAPPRASTAFLQPAVRLDLAQSSVEKIGGLQGRPGMVALTAERQLLAERSSLVHRPLIAT